MSMLRLLAGFVSMSLVAVTFVMQPALAADRMVQCGIVPQFLSALSDGKSYALVLGSVDREPADLEIALYSKSEEYRVSLHDVGFEGSPERDYIAPRRLFGRSYGFQSAPRVIALPRADVLTLAVLERPANATSSEPACMAYFYSEGYRQVMNPRYVTPKTAKAENAKLAETPASNGTVLAVDVGPNPFSCVSPFLAPLVVKPVEPVYPDLARDTRANGTVDIRVVVDERGSLLSATISTSSGNGLLDRAGLAAARASTYRPARMRCEPAGGELHYNAVFSSL